MKWRGKRLFGVLLVMIAMLRSGYSCYPEPARLPVTSLQLRWVRSYPSENWTTVKKGLLWSLSLMGAKLDSAQADSIIMLQDSTIFKLDLVKAGFNAEALKAFDAILEKIISSEEYKNSNSFDLGRFLMLTQHSSWHYYRIVNAPQTIGEFYKLHPVDSSREFRLHTSCVTKNMRTIRFGTQHTWKDVCFIAEEHASQDENSGIVSYETFDVMPNGQLRFMVYDANGKLIAGSTEQDGPGKPTKCSWCHESQVQPLYFTTQLSAIGIDTTEFLAGVVKAQKLIDEYRSTLPIMIDYRDRHAHELAEYLYVGFMEPTALRLANEWNADSSKVKSIMKNSTMHDDHEYHLFNSQWFRYHVDSLSGLHLLTVPRSAREVFEGEPDYFR